MECRKCSYYDYGLGGQYCDKVGGKTLTYGYCTDVYCLNDQIHRICSKKKKRNKRERDLKYKKHVKFLAQTISYYPPPAMPVDENGRWNFEDPAGTVYYRRTYKGNHKKNRYKFYKKYANRVVRRYKGEMGNGCCYKKCFDYAWTVD